MAEYKYIFGTLRDEKVLADIPLRGTYMDLELNVGGRFDGSFSLDMTGYDNATLINATEPGRTFVVAERDGKPVWCGFVWSRVFQSQSKNVQLFAQSFEKYPNYQLIRGNYLQTDEQLEVFYGLWTDMQSVVGRNINVIVPSSGLPTIVPRTIDILATDFKFYGEVISSFADSSTGFDWTIDVAKTGNQYFKTLRAGYPTLGTTDPTLLTFDYPGAVLNYYATESMAEAATHIYTLGAGEGATMLTHEAAHDDLVASGFPRWDLVVTRKDIDSATNLESFGIQEGVNRRAPRLTLKPSMKSGLNPEFASFGLGDACTVAIRDSRFPNDKRFTGRIIKWILQPQSAENVDEYAVLFQGDEGE